MVRIEVFYILVTLTVSSIPSARAACTKVCLDNCSGAARARGPKLGCFESLPKCDMAEVRRKQKYGGRWTPCRHGNLLDGEGYSAQDLVLLSKSKRTGARACLQSCKKECSVSNFPVIVKGCIQKCIVMVRGMARFGLKRNRKICRSLPSKYIAREEAQVYKRTNLLKRRRRLFKAHGRWCGPNWTDGKKISAGEYRARGGNFHGLCIDKADCACRYHDYQCAMAGGCCKSHDRLLIKRLKGTGSPWISSAMRVASWTRSC